MSSTPAPQYDQELGKALPPGANITDVADNDVVWRSGYTPAYRRVFRTAGVIAVSVAMASPLSAIFVSAIYMTTYGGYWGLTWGWVIPSFLLLGQTLALAELCSSMPINGAFYWWTGALSPRSVSRPLSFILGWLSIFATIASLASFAFALGSTYSALISALHPTWTPTRPQEFAMSIGVMVIWFLLNLVKMERFVLVILATAALIFTTSIVYVIGVPAAHAAKGLPFASASQALGTYTNYSAWDRAVALPMTFFAVAWSVQGWQSPAFVAEETINASVTAPRSMITSYSLMAFIGAIVCWVAAFCIGDMDATAADPTGMPLISMLMENWGPKVAIAFVLICFTCTALGGASFLFSSACQAAAFARDGGLPLYQRLSTVDGVTNMPIYSMAFLLTGSFLLLLFALSPAAGTIIYSLAVIATMVTAALPIALRIFAGDRFKPGPFNYGRLSIPIHIWGFSVTCYITVMETFPSTPNWTAATFNYNWVVCSGVVGLAVISWFSFGSANYKGKAGIGEFATQGLTQDDASVMTRSMTEGKK